MEDPSGPAAPVADRSWLRRHLPLVSGSTAIVLAVLLGVLIVVRQQEILLGLDEEWAEEMLDVRGPVGEWLALVFDTVGGHLIGTYLVPIGVSLLLLLIRLRWAALFFLTCSIVSAGLVQLLKQLFGRARPADMLVTSDFGSFPSGHVANAATIAVAIGIIVPVVWVRVAGAAWVVLMAVSRTYLGAHWLTDTVGGALLGAGVVLVLWSLFAARLDAERSARRRPLAEAAAG